jgi:hypothetical protein
LEFDLADGTRVNDEEFERWVLRTESPVYLRPHWGADRLTVRCLPVSPSRFLEDQGELRRRRDVMHNLAQDRDPERVFVRVKDGEISLSLVEYGAWLDGFSLGAIDWTHGDWKPLPNGWLLEIEFRDLAPSSRSRTRFNIAVPGLIGRVLRWLLKLD